jgi:hypothetical protein
MTLRSRLRGSQFAYAAIGPWLLLACGHKHQDAAGEAASAALPAMSAPHDHLAPGELVEGEQRVFAFTLPRDLQVEQNYDGVVFASGAVSALDLANYVRARVRDGTVSVGAAATVFDGVRIASEPQRVLYIRVVGTRTAGRARLEMRDITPIPQPEFPDNATRMRSVGLTPEGKLVDPQHLK